MRYLVALLMFVAFPVGAATVTWTAPLLNNDGSKVTETVNYNLYQGLQGGPLVKVQTGIAGTKATVVSGLAPGTTQCFAVTAYNTTNNTETALSSPLACLVIPPAAPTVLVPQPPTNVKVTLS